MFLLRTAGNLPPITPSPPAFVTAAASLGPAATFIPASRIGALIPNNSVIGVFNPSVIFISVCFCF
eukprot:maker-scaffold_29-snap-gene-0.53-mRNA-1 protein AED:0.03 eAED:0.03 QI:934/1/1/1/0/0/2/25/65